jgi:hypothetical protein
MYVVEREIESSHLHPDPSSLEIDAVFESGGRTWRVPAFWRGGSRWTVRFAPPEPGRYALRWESSDVGDTDVHGRTETVEVDAAAEKKGSTLWRHGPLGVSANGRTFEHADGTPFFWLGDTMWGGLSDRLTLDAFREFIDDRLAKGFTVLQAVAGFVPEYEEDAGDPGYCNEGGPVWEDGFARVNPAYFDAADRRIEMLLDAGILPAIVGAWGGWIHRIGVERMKQHWRYIVARYAAYPVVWISGGEVYDPPEDHGRAEMFAPHSGWTEVTAYFRSIDAHRRLVTIHEIPPPYDSAIRDESLLDFDMFQSGHSGWPSLQAGIAQITSHYGRTSVTRPLVQGEIGYEQIGETHLADFQRAAFWTTMLNGAAGFTYGAVATWQAYTPDKALHRYKYGWLHSDEGMRLPGSTQIGYGADLLRRYPWWRLEPRPDWVIPRGTTLLEPRDGVSGFDIDLVDAERAGAAVWDERLPLGEWADAGGTFRLPYAAGIPGVLRIVYLPYFGFASFPPVTVLALEPGVTYAARYWQPALGIFFDLGSVTVAVPGELLPLGGLETGPDGTVVATSVDECDVVASIAVTHEGGIPRREVALLVRRTGEGDHVAAVRVPGGLELRAAARGEERVLAHVDVPAFDGPATLVVEVAGENAAASLRTPTASWTTPITQVGDCVRGAVGIRGHDSALARLEVRRSPDRPISPAPDPELVDAEGRSRGRLDSPGWEDFGRRGVQLLDAYRPEPRPALGDWILILDASPEAQSASHRG